MAATEKELEPIVAATRRPNNALCGAADVGVRVGKVINHYKVARHFVTTIIERAFRSLKSVDLRVRPMHHRRADRVRAYVLLGMFAYYVEWHMRQTLAPLSTTTTRRLPNDSAPRWCRRSSARPRHAPRPPANAPPTPSPCTASERCSRTSRRQPPNTMQVADGDATFTLLTEPTSGQTRSFGQWCTVRTARRGLDG